MNDEGIIITKDKLLIGNWTPVRNEVLFSTVLSQGAKLCDELKRVQLIRVEQRGLTQSNIYYIYKPVAKLLKPIPLQKKWRSMMLLPGR